MLDVNNIIQSGGLAVIAAIVFFESGMLVGFFLPGDTLLVSTGVFAAQGKLPIVWAILIIALAGIMGDNFGYSIGKKMGPRILQRKDGRLFRRAYMTRAVDFYQKHGRKSMLLAHFVPYVRTFAPIVAGVAGMNRTQYIIYDALGVSIWASSITLLGYFVGSKIPNIDHYIVPVMFTVVVVAFGPAVHHILRNWSRSRRQAAVAQLDLDEE